MWGQPRSWEPGDWSIPTGRPRVLIEDPDGAIRSTSERFLLREGFDVASCGGPEEMGRRACPLLTTGSCTLTAGADMVYTSLRWHHPQSREVLRALRVRHPRTPLVVEIPSPAAERLQEVLEGCHVVHMPVGRTAMVGAIRGALAQGLPGQATSPA